MKDELPHLLSIKDVVSLSGVSKMMNSSFNTEDIWKTLYIQASINDFCKKSLVRMLKRKERPIKTQDWSEYRINAEGVCTLVLENDSEIPYDIYWGRPHVIQPQVIQPQVIHAVDGANVPPPFNPVKSWKHMGQVLPGQRYIAKNAVTNQRWCLVPTKEWLKYNPYSNFTFSFVIDASEISENVRFSDTVVKPAFLKQINSDKDKVKKPFKGLTKIKDFRKATVKRLVDPIKLKKKKTLVSHKRKVLEERRKTMKKQLLAIERELRDVAIIDGGCDLTKRLLEK